MLDEYETLLVQRKLVGEQPAITDHNLLQLVGSCLAPANIVRAERLVDELLACVDSIGNIHSHGFVHKSPLFLQRPYHQARYHGNVLSLSIQSFLRYLKIAFI